MIIEDRTDALAKVHKQVFGHLDAPKKSAAARSTAPVSADDAAVIEKVTKPTKWAQVWNGSHNCTSDSEADLALVGRIAFFVG